MKWTIMRNEQNEIIKYELTKDIYIEREYQKTFEGNYFVNHLIVNGVNILDTAGGYTLKDLKKLGETKKENK